MNQEDLLDDIHRDLKSAGFSNHKDVSRKILRIVLDCLFNRIVQGYNVPIKNFGSFKSKLRNFTDPSSTVGGKVTKWSITFSPSKIMKEKINQKDG